MFGSEMFVPHASTSTARSSRSSTRSTTCRSAATGAPRQRLATATHDRRWELIRRPVVVVGGELTLEMLDLIYNPIARFYEAPLQVKANGGMFLIDDFGRQRIPPRTCSTAGSCRWRTASTSSPCTPARSSRSRSTSSSCSPPTSTRRSWSTRRSCGASSTRSRRRTRRGRVPADLRAELRSADRVRSGDGRVPASSYYQPRKLQMRACHPRDLVEQVVDICRYQEREPTITRELLDQACGSYFLEEVGSQGSGNMKRWRAGGSRCRRRRRDGRRCASARPAGSAP